MALPSDPHVWTSVQFQAFKQVLNDHDRRKIGRTLTLPDNVGENMILDQALFVKGSDPQLFNQLRERANVKKVKG